MRRHIWYPVQTPFCIFQTRILQSHDMIHQKSLIYQSSCLLNHLPPPLNFLIPPLPYHLSILNPRNINNMHEQISSIKYVDTPSLQTAHRQISPQYLFPPWILSSPYLLTLTHRIIQLTILTYCQHPPYICSVKSISNIEFCSVNFLPN